MKAASLHSARAQPAFKSPRSPSSFSPFSVPRSPQMFTRKTPPLLLGARPPLRSRSGINRAAHRCPQGRRLPSDLAHDLRSDLDPESTYRASRKSAYRKEAAAPHDRPATRIRIAWLDVFRIQTAISSPETAEHIAPLSIKKKNIVTKTFIKMWNSLKNIFSW